MNRWERDLTKDIRTHSKEDDKGDPPNWPLPGVPIEFSICDQEALQRSFLTVKDRCKCILEIGVHRPITAGETENSSTKCLLRNKNKDTVYLGVDLQDRKFIDNPEENTYTIKIGSGDYDIVLERLKRLGCSKIDYLMIDGEHSINQVYQDWEYTKIMDEGSIVALHDVAYHPGPQKFIRALKRDLWDIELDCFDPEQTEKIIKGEITGRPEGVDYGMAFVRKKY